jgi:hypothetical protein
MRLWRGQHTDVHGAEVRGPGIIGLEGFLCPWGYIPPRNPYLASFGLRAIEQLWTNSIQQLIIQSLNVVNTSTSRPFRQRS